MIKDSMDCDPNSHVTVSKILKMSSNKDWGWKPGNIIIVTRFIFTCELLHEGADLWVGVDVEVTFCI